VAQAATCAGRTLRGEKPADLRSKALGLTIPETLSATGDEVIHSGLTPGRLFKSVQSSARK
jgi:hypothetical protein